MAKYDSVSEIPPIEMLKERFYNLDDRLLVKVDHAGYVHELKSDTPFNGIVTVKDVINMTDRTILVIPKNKEDIVKLRNSIIFYNEYFCKEHPDYTRAPIAHEIFEKMYLEESGYEYRLVQSFNPFIDPIMQEIAPTEDLDDSEEISQSSVDMDFDALMKESMANRKKMDIGSNTDTPIRIKQDIETIHTKASKEIYSRLGADMTPNADYHLNVKLSADIEY